jgi:hypothetical protein
MSSVQINECGTLCASELEEREAMAWTKPCNGKSRINTAGEIISARRMPTDEISVDVAYDIAGNWRSSHGYPLQIAWQALQRRAKKVHSKALVAKRIKRMPSIAAKLARFNTMQLSTMQDLGGCRAVVRDIKQVDELVEYYEKHPLPAFIYDEKKKKDYIAHPKPDGYRGVHLIYSYNRDTQNGAYRGLRIEIQIRSFLQHTWATAVEIIDTFTGQGLKSGQGQADWERFFALVGSALAFFEHRPLVPNTPDNREALCEEFRPICERLHIPEVFTGIAHGVHSVEEKEIGEPSLKFKPRAYILTLDSEEKKTITSAFRRVKDAEAKLLALEKENKDKPHLQSVMASAGSLHALRKAYPNYFVDTYLFVNLMEFLKLQPGEREEFIRKFEKIGDKSKPKT